MVSNSSPKFGWYESWSQFSFALGVPPIHARSLNIRVLVLGIVRVFWVQTVVVFWGSFGNIVASPSLDLIAGTCLNLTRIGNPMFDLTSFKKMKAREIFWFYHNYLIVSSQPFHDSSNQLIERETPPRPRVSLARKIRPHKKTRSALKTEDLPNVSGQESMSTRTFYVKLCQLWFRFGSKVG